MDFNLTPEQLDFQGAVRRFAQGELRDGAVERAHSDDYPWDVARKMARQGAHPQHSTKWLSSTI
ncbi:acyl-CoA dehydrogenase family protein, partial [Achromobacter insolitus]|uniref:acyl-CoA dehydrogenase family protein n=1 Tax=Achromobacter insolitus TaxID=217204 RepID=UPI002FDF9657